MYKQIVVAIDGSDLTSRVLEHAFALGRFSGASVLAVTVTEPPVLVGPAPEFIISTADLLAEFEKARVAEARATLDSAKRAAVTAGIEIEMRHVRNAFPADGIVSVSEEVAADLVIMGSHGRRGLNRLVLGSQANEVLTRSKVPVLVVR